MSRPQTFSNGHPADDLLDVDAAVAQRRALLVGLGDLGLERDDALQAVVYLGHRRDSFVSSVRPSRHAEPTPWARPIRGILHPAPPERVGGPPRGSHIGSARMEPRADRDWPALRARVRRRGPARVRPGRRPDHDVRPLVRTTRSTPGCTSPTRWCVATVSRRRAAVVADGAAQGRRRARLRVLHQPARRARATSSPATRRARCCSRGTRSSARCGSTGSPRSCCRGGRRGVLRHPPARLAARGLGLAPVPSRRVAATELADGVRRGRGAVRRRDEVPVPAGVGRLRRRARRPWSSGRAARAGCTTGCVYRRRRTAAGPRERLAP